jgi:spore coat polysaccharide biosynthesis protein SpsF (cytidylyltransferase family)
MSTTAIIQARMGSSRFPGKVMASLGELTVLEHVIRRALMIAGVDDVVVATTAEPEDDIIERETQRHGLRCVRLTRRLKNGHNDVLARFVEVILSSTADTVLRITADCPVLDPQIAGQVLRMVGQGIRYASNVYPVRTYPDGLDVEAMEAQVVLEAAQRATNLADREHVTPYIQRSYAKACLVWPEDLSEIRWTLDTPEDLTTLTMLLSRAGGRIEGRSSQVLPWTDLLRAQRVLTP